MTERERLLDQVRSLQRAPGAAPSRRTLRVVLEFDAAQPPAAVAARLRLALGIEVEVAPLLADPPSRAAPGGLDRFLAASIPGVRVADLAGSPFELAYAMADASGAVTAEPETGAGFYVVRESAEPGLEGLDAFPPGCWVDQAGDPTPALPYWALDAIRARAAWETAPAAGGRARGEGISVFQPDTGVADHVEIEPGMLDLGRAHDFVADRPGATDPMNYGGNPGHGTGTASVVASRIAGIMAGSAPLATLVPLRAVESVVVFDHGRVAAAVEHARRNGAEVITMSLGGPWSSALRAAIDAAIRDGVIVLAAAGNCVGFVVWPARYEEVIAVAGSNRADRPWKGSCRGEAVDISAPGEFVPRANRSPANGGSPESVAGGQGTSFAVALTAGVAALWLAHHGPDAIRRSLGPSETVQSRFVGLLRASARRVPGLDPDDFGAGVVDAAGLLGLGLGPAALEEMPGPAAAADGLHSLRSLLAESPVAAPMLEGVPAPAAAAADRRFAAELSHLAMQAGLARQGAAQLEATTGALAPSPTLLAAMAARPGG